MEYLGKRDYYHGASDHTLVDRFDGWHDLTWNWSNDEDPGRVPIPPDFLMGVESLSGERTHVLHPLIRAQFRELDGSTLVPWYTEYQNDQLCMFTLKPRNHAKNLPIYANGHFVERVQSVRLEVKYRSVDAGV